MKWAQGYLGRVEAASAGEICCGKGLRSCHGIREGHGGSCWSETGGGETG